jgi:hypothetical protein
MNGGVNEGKLQLFEFLRGLSHKGRHLLVNPNKLLSLQQMQQALLRGDRYLDEFDDEVSWRGVGSGRVWLVWLVWLRGLVTWNGG